MAKLTIELGPSATEQLGELADTLETTKAEVVRGALDLFAHVTYTILDGPEKLHLALVKHDNRELDEVIVVPKLSWHLYEKHRKQPLRRRVELEES